MRHVVVDARALSPRRDGISTYIREVVPRVIGEMRDSRFSIIASPSTAAEVARWGAEVTVSTCRPMWPRQNWSIPRTLRRLRPDLYFYPAHDPPFGPLSSRLVMAIHDVNTVAFPGYFERADTLKRYYVRTVTRHGIARASAILAASEATLNAIGATFGAVAAAKTSVVPYAPGFAGRAPRSAGSHLLYIGSDRPHKNVERLVEAYGQATRVGGVPDLVLVGTLRRPDELTARIEAAGVTSRVRVLGHIPDEAVDALLATAVVLVLPSLAEGFGLPILDAMAKGVPVITSDRSSCKEVAGEAALLVDPTDVEAISAALLQVIRDESERERLSELGRWRASEFDWAATAAATADVVSGALP